MKNCKIREVLATCILRITAKENQPLGIVIIEPEPLERNAYLYFATGLPVSLMATVQNVNVLMQEMARYKSNSPVFVFSRLEDSRDFRMPEIFRPKYFVPHVIGVEDTKSKYNSKKCRAILY